jgi:hypothetical protein
MSQLPKPPQNINPLWIITLFFSFTEIVLGVAIANTSGGIQIALTTFVIIFPFSSAIGFFILLWSRPQHLYAPKDYTNDETFLKSIESARTSRTNIVNLDKEIQDRVNNFLTSDELVQKLADSQGEQLKKLLQTTADDITSDIRESNFFTISLKKISPDLDDMIIPADGFTSFDSLTNEIYFALDGAVPPYTYGTTWVLKDKKSKNIFRHARMITGAGSGRFVEDNRTLNEVGIKAGMSLEVVSPEKLV